MRLGNGTPRASPLRAVRLTHCQTRMLSDSLAMSSLEGGWEGSIIQCNLMGNPFGAEYRGFSRGALFGGAGKAGAHYEYQKMSSNSARTQAIGFSDSNYCQSPQGLLPCTPKEQPNLGFVSATHHHPPHSFSATLPLERKSLLSMKCPWKANSALTTPPAL